MKWGFLLIALLLVACGPKAEVVKLPDEPVQVQEQPTQQDRQVEQPTFEPPVTSQFSAWGAIAFNASNMLSHEFTVTQGVTGGATVYQRAHLVRIDYRKPQSINGGKIIDRVYFDTKERKAVGFCRDHEDICKPYAGERIPLTFTKYYIRTPRDWVLQFATQSPLEYEEDAQIISSRFTDKFVFRSGNGKTSLFIDQYTKLPVRVVEEGPGYKHTFEYDDIRVGSVEAKVVFH